MLIQDELKDILTYNLETGIFIWNKDVCKKCKAGQTAGSFDCGYIRITIKSKRFLAHRLAWLYINGTWPIHNIDHINGIKSDNRICNLRLATIAENQQNRLNANANSTHGYLGITWNKKTNKWLSKIMLNKKRIHIGYFETAIEAHNAYIETKRKLHIYCTI